MISFAQMFGTLSPDCTQVSPQCNTAVCRNSTVTAVGTLTDEQREAAITRASLLIAKGGVGANHARTLRDQLIAGRSPESIARIARALGAM
jgi:hypothetical protein